MAINGKKQNTLKATHSNFMGGESYDVKNPLVQLRIVASTCFFGEPSYYLDGSAGKSPKAPQGASRVDQTAVLGQMIPPDWHSLSPAALLESVIDNALDHDPEATLQEAVRLRCKEHIRATPQVILVRAANHPKVRGTALIRLYAPEIIARADEPAVGLAYQLSKYGAAAPIPNALKKAWAKRLALFSEYELAKYQMTSREVKTVDVVNLTHAQSEAINKLCKGTLTNTGETWEAIVSAEGSTKESWTKSVGVMGHMALLRNLRNFLMHDVPQELFLDKLVAGAKTGKQLPFRYISAYYALKELEKTSGKQFPRVIDAVEACLRDSIDLLPKFSGRVMSLCDNSGSAHGQMTSSLGTMSVAKIGNLQGILAGLCGDEGHVGVFGDRLTNLPVRKSRSIFDMLDDMETSSKNVGGSTENGIWLFFKNAIKNKEVWDHVFVFSDMQAGHGGLYGVDPSEYNEFRHGGSHGRNIDVAKLIRKYRSEVNKNAKFYLVQTAGYKDTIVPEWYDKTYILGGWGEGLLRFAHEMSEINP